MPKDEKPRSYSTLPVSDVAELLSVTDRQVRNWINDKGLPAKKDPRGLMLDWPATLKWYVGFQIGKSGGNDGNRRAGNDPEPPEPPLESFKDALARRTRAEADIKELQLAHDRAEVVAVADVEKVLAGANKSIQTLILALPTSLTPQLIGMSDRNKIQSLINHACKSLLSNLAEIDAVRAVRVTEDSEAN